MKFRIIRTNDAPAVDRTPFTVERWYDRSARVWTAYVVNAAGDQISDAQHSHTKDGVSLNMDDYRVY